MAYKHGNLSDQVKHANLEMLVRKLRPSCYIEFHSAEGIYENPDGTKYEGSSVRVMNILRDLQVPFAAYLHEKDSKLRAKLIENTSSFSEVQVRAKWQDNIGEYIERTPENSLFLVDPTYLGDFRELQEPIKLLLQKNANMFLFIPKRLEVKEDEEIFDETLRIVLESTQHFRIGGNPAYSFRQHKKRYDYNIIISKADVIEKLKIIKKDRS